MSARSDHLHTTIAVLASAVLHALVVGVAGITSMSSCRTEAPLLNTLPASAPLPPIIEPPPPPPSDSIPVGNPDSTITAETWLGYNEFLEHVGTKRAPIDQPALTFDPPTAQPDAPPAPIASPPTPPASLAMPAPAVEPSMAAAEAPPESESTEPPDTAEEKPAPSQPQTSPPAERITLDKPKSPEPAPPQETTPPEEPASGDQPAPLTETRPPPPSEPAETQGPPTEPTPPAQPEQPSPAAPADPSQPQAPSAPSMPAPPPSPSASDDSRGEQSDRESDAAAVKTAAKARLGKPLATRGLRIRTVKPRSSHYNAILARYVDPVVRVHFNRKGVVEKVEFLRHSENRDVDLYVMNAVYQWTAEGPQLDELPVQDPPATIAVDFVIVRPLSG